MKPVRIPRRVDEPPHLLMWSADELSPLLMGIFVGVMIDNLLICAGIGLLVTNLYRKFRDNHPDGLLLHILYWAGIPVSKGKCFRNPFVRRYFP